MILYVFSSWDLYYIYSVIDIASRGKWIVIDSPRTYSHETGTLGKLTGNNACPTWV